MVTCQDAAISAWALGASSSLSRLERGAEGAGDLDPEILAMPVPSEEARLFPAGRQTPPSVAGHVLSR